MLELITRGIWSKVTPVRMMIIELLKFCLCMIVIAKYGWSCRCKPRGICWYESIVTQFQWNMENMFLCIYIFEWRHFILFTTCCLYSEIFVFLGVVEGFLLRCFLNECISHTFSFMAEWYDYKIIWTALDAFDVWTWAIVNTAVLFHLLIHHC